LGPATEADPGGFTLGLAKHGDLSEDDESWGNMGRYPHGKCWFNDGLMVIFFMGFNQQNGGFNGRYPLVN